MPNDEPAGHNTHDWGLGLGEMRTRRHGDCRPGEKPAESGVAQAGSGGDHKIWIPYAYGFLRPAHRLSQARDALCIYHVVGNRYPPRRQAHGVQNPSRTNLSGPVADRRGNQLRFLGSLQRTHPRQRPEAMRGPLWSDIASLANMGEGSHLIPNWLQP